MRQTSAARAGRAEPRERATPVYPSPRAHHPAVPIEAKLLLTDQEVAQLTGASRSKVREWIRAGRLPSLKLDGLRRVRRGDLDAFIEQGAAAGAS